MKIKLDSWKVKDLTFAISESKEKIKNSFDLSTGHYFPELESNKFCIEFDVKIKDKKFDLTISALFMFSLDDTVTEQFKISDFPKINAPAIAFPYLRAFISNFTLQSGFKPVMLPSINFVALANIE